jgi:hypothetical protein
MSPNGSQPGAQQPLWEIRLDPGQLRELKHTPKAQWLGIPLLSLVISFVLSALVSGGVAYWTTKRTEEQNKLTITSASEIARSEREYRQSQTERQYADKAGIVIRKWKDQGFVRVQVANTGSKPLRELRMERAEGSGKLTYIRLALVNACQNARFAIPYDWWRNRPYLVFRDDQKRWWKLYEGETAMDGTSVGVGEPVGNGTLYTGPLPPKETKVDYSDGERVFKPYRKETQIPCS